MTKIAVIGGGAWGKALYHAFSQKNQVCIVSRRDLRQENVNFQQCSLQKAVQSDYLVMAISSAALRSFLRDNQQFFRKENKFLVAAKGIEEESGAFVSEIMESFFDSSSLAYLAGPSFAFEVQKGLPCAVMIHSCNLSLARQMQILFPTFMRTYVSDDVLGGEIAGAYKNVIAIASGICMGLNLGENARASLLARGLVEMERFGQFFGAKMETFLGLSGSGDLFLTSNSTLSRNFRVGLSLAQNKKIEDIIQELGEIAEGIKTAKAIVSLSRKHKICTPIATEVTKIINGKNVEQSLQEIFGVKGEQK